jgi:thioredoxin reductase
MKIHDVTIIGAGPAGIAAALQLKRYGLDPLLLEAQQVGGLLLNANLVENYPGFPQGIPGPELVALFKSQLDAVGVRICQEEVHRLSFIDGLFVVETTRQRACHLVVVATGTRPNKAEIGLSSPLRERIFYEVYPLLGFRAKKIAIIGAGDAAFDYALNLARFNEVTILNRGKEIKALPLLRERVSASSQIAYCESTELIQILMNLDGLRLECRNDTAGITLHADYLIFAIGRIPRLDFLQEGFPLEELCNRGRLHLVGDVKNDRYRQTAIAVGEGVHAAMRAYRILKESEGS